MTLSDYYFQTNTAGAHDSLDLGSPAQRYTHNLKAIRLLKELEATQREPIPDEQKVLAHYTGWGDTQVFNRLIRERDLTNVLTETEWAGLRASTNNAHFTAIPIVQAIWDGLAMVGYDKLDHPRFLDPSAGVGHFGSCMPRRWWEQSQVIEIELDPLTGHMLEHLHPHATVKVCGFEEITFPKGWFDLSVTNVPFGDYPVIDQRMAGKLKTSIHNYFFARTLELLRPGGVLAFITSRYTLDAKDNTIRQWLAERADLLCAVRLPEGTFRVNAGTDVVTDVIVFRKRPEGVPKGSADWVDIDTMKMPNRWGNPVAGLLNTIFVQHPEWLLGKPELKRGMYQDDEFSLLPDGRAVPEALRDILSQSIPADCLTYHHNRQMAVVPTPVHMLPPLRFAPQGKTREEQDRLSALENLYTTAKALLDAEIHGRRRDVTEPIRARLNREYDTFVAYYGPIHGQRNVKALKGDPTLPFLKALEVDYKSSTNTARKADLFTKSTVRAEQVTCTALDAKEALLISLDAFGEVNMNHIAYLLDCEISEVIRRLKCLVYETPQGEWLTAEAYLSGDLRVKLLEARAAAELDERFRDNVRALERVYPKPLQPGEISARLGAGWVPHDVIEQFMRFLIPGLETEGVYLAPLGQWVLRCNNRWMLNTAEARGRWGTQRCNVVDLVDDALNGVITRVYDIEPDDRRVLNTTETIAAQAMGAEIKAKFEEWVWSDPDRATKLATLYNERYNTLRARTYDGSHLKLPGLNNTIELMTHQKDAIWRALQSKATLLGHEVGLGKTLSITCAIMEMRRLGLAKKGLVVVPNHLTGQWLNEVLWAYPNANVLCASKDDFTKANRGTFLSRIATGNWDIVIVPMSSFKRLPVSPQVMAEFFQSEIDRLEDYLYELKQNKSPGAATKEIEKAKKRFKAKLAGLADMRKDASETVVWEELGIGVLAVDEFHLYKNLFFATKMTRIAGLPNSESERAFDMFVKIRWLLTHAGRVVCATGTPVSNTLAEVYTMQRYLKLELLVEKGLDQFDSWAKTFAEAVPSMEMTPDGAGYRMNTRFSKFVNLPELVTLWRQTLDVRKADQTSVKRPRLYGGKPATVQLAATPALKAYVEGLAKRSERIHSGAVDPSIDNMLKVTNEGRKAALDLSLVVPRGSDAPSAKIDALVENLFAIWQLTKDDRATQLVFCDLATPKPKADKSPHVAKE